MYIMKISFKMVVVIFAFIFIICMSMGSGSSFTPYSFSSSSRLHQYPYEGFSQYTTYPQNTVIDSYESKRIEQPAMGDVVKVRGFDGLLVSPNAPEKSIDIYSQALGENTCKSYGLMNSRGYLCLNPEQIQQLTTRGGNMSAYGDSVIG